MSKALRIFYLFFLPFILFLTAGNFFVSAEELRHEVHFRICKADVDETWRNNLNSIKSLQDFLSQKTPSYIYIKASASPDGPLSLNSKLAEDRASSTVSLLKRLCPSLSDSLFVVSTISEDIDGTISYIRESGQEWAQEAVSILQKGGKDPEEGLRRYMGGKVWRYLADNVFPLLRRTEITIQYSTGIASGSPAGLVENSDTVNTPVNNGPVASNNDVIAPSNGSSGSNSSSKVPAWALAVMGVLAVTAGSFGALFARERARNRRAVPNSAPVSPSAPSTAQTPSLASIPPSSAPAPAPDPAPDPSPVNPVIVPIVPVAAPEESEPAEEAPSFLERVKAIIKENVSDSSFGVEELAAKVGISRIHLNRKLKTEADASPSALLKEARMDLAASMLKEGKMSIAEIAVQSGFSTPSYFATAFKDYFKVSPSEFVSGLN